MKKYIAILPILAITLLSLSAIKAHAGDGPAANDAFAGAEPLIMQGDSTGVIAGNHYGTKEPGEPNHAGNQGGRSMWFKFTPTVTKVIRINTTDNTFDTLLAVYTGNAVNNLQLVGYNDNGSAHPLFGGASTVDLMMVAGTTYYIAVDSVYDQGVSLEGTFKLALLQCEAPFQDNINSAYNLGQTWRGGSIAGTNYSATMEVNEPIASTAIGRGKSVWYRWVSSETMAAYVEVTDNFDSQVGIYKASAVPAAPAQLTQVASRIDYTGYTTSRYRAIFRAEANQTYYIQIDSQGISDQDGLVGNFQLKFGPSRLSYSAMFASSATKSSPALFRPSDGTWYILSDTNQMVPTIRKWGIDGDTAIAADFQGNGASQLAAIRNQNGQKVWYIGTGAVIQQSFAWGLSTDKVMVGDFDRDGIADPVAIRNSANGFVWYARRSSNNSLRALNWGTTGDKPVVGDFDGDRYTDAGVIRNAPGGLVWYVLRSGMDEAQLYTTSFAVQFGVAGDLAAAADYDGDLKTDIAVYRPSTGTWYILRSSDGQVQMAYFGIAGDKPQPADYDGDGKADLGLYRPSEGMWYFWLSGTDTQQSLRWGTSGDTPVSSINTLSH